MIQDTKNAAECKLASPDPSVNSMRRLQTRPSYVRAQHALLDKDYVVVKILGGNDVSAEAVMEQLGRALGQGIPWMAITEPDGNVLATSEGPLGNTGFPGSIEEVRHLRAMLSNTARQLTSQEQDELAASLPARK